jgi:hypothetical protein
LSNGNCSDQEKREIIIELNTSRCKILKDLPVLPPFKFENIKTVTHLLKEINRHLHDRYKKENIPKCKQLEVLSEEDYLLPTGKIEVFLPKTQSLKDFIYTQGMYYSCGVTCFD